MAYSEYRDLTPTDSVDNGDEYIEALNWAFQNKKVRNIALTGPYGAGKSSIIETLLRKNDEDKSALNKIRSSALKISMATFLKGNAATDDHVKIEVDADEVEKGILKQLFYKVEPSRIPQSRYRKLHPIKRFKTFFYVSVAMLFVLLFMEAMMPTTRDKFMKVIERVVSPVFPAPLFTQIAAGLLLVFIVWIITCLYRTAISKFRVKEIKLPADTTVQSGAEETDSVFNRNLDEIMYFFEETGYKTVFFEDLDRLDDPKIFVHLRELNNLLNNDDAIKAKPIVFVYAVRDDIFSKEDRTKFFDFIIPVIPIINSTNSGEILLQRLQEAKANGIEHDISQGFVLDISPFISDMRILQNIYNEFVIYKKTLRMSQELSLSDEQMLAMLVFKNLYPSDFADIQDEKGVLKKAFVDKSDFIARKKQSIQEDIDNYSSVIRGAQNDTCKTIRELKYAMLGTLMGGPYRFNSFNDGNALSIEAAAIMDDDYDMNLLIQGGYKSVYYNDYNNYHGNNKKVTIKVDNLATYVERWNVIKEVGEKGLEHLQAELEKFRERQHKLSGMSIVELLKVYPTNEVFSANVKANKLLVFLLRRGYIDEKYASYINYFKGTSITKDDMNFILAVKNQTPLDFDYHLTKIPMVVERLQEYEFEQKAIYNFDLLEELLGEENSEKLMAFIQQLADGDDLSWRFIDEFVNRTSQQPLFIRLLSKNWTGMWAHISADETLTYDHQLMYLQNILSESEISTIEAQNIDSCMIHYFEEHADILQKLRDCNNEKIISVIDSLDMHFPALNTATVPSNVLDSIFEKHHYVMNEEMLKTIIAYKNSDFLDEFEGKPYSTLITLNYSALLQYVQDNVVEFVDEIVLAHRSLSDSPEDIVDMLIRLEGETEIQVKLVEQESFCVDCIDACAGEYVQANKNAWMSVWNALLKKNAVKVSWENVFDYWKVYQFSEALKEYVNSHAEELAEIDAAVVNDSFIKAFIGANLEQEIEQKLLPVLRLEKFDLEISSIAEPTLRIMVDCNYFEFTADRYTEVNDVSSEIGIKFILKNQEDYMSLSNSIPMTSSLLEQLVFNDGFAVNNRHQVFCDYAESYMTEKIAMQMKAHDLPVSRDIFEAAWNCIAQEDHIELLLDYCTILNASELKQYFAELKAPYSELSDRSRRHEVSLPINDKNKALAEHLKKIGYLTNWEEKTEKYFDVATNCEKIRKVLKLRVKQVR